MGILKESGYTNKEISTLTREKWSEPIIKLYTRGTNIKDSTPKANATRVIVEMISRGLTFEQVILATSIKSEIDLTEGNVALQDLLNLIEKVKKSSIDISEVIKLFNRLKSEPKLSSLLFRQLSDSLALQVRIRNERDCDRTPKTNLAGVQELCRIYYYYKDNATKWKGRGRRRRTKHNPNTKRWKKRRKLSDFKDTKLSILI